jgi:hypothetical protein
MPAARTDAADNSEVQQPCRLALAACDCQSPSTWIFWLVHLRLDSGDEAWFEFDALNLRPRRQLVLETRAKPPSS